MVVKGEPNFIGGVVVADPVSSEVGTIINSILQMRRLRQCLSVRGKL